MNAIRGDKAPALSSSSPVPSITSLQQQIWQIEGSIRPDDPARISAGHPALDQLLPDGGYLPGMLVEFISESPGDAAGWLSLRLVVEALQRGGAAVLVDPAGELYAPALVSLGVPLERLVLVQGESGGRAGRGDAGWAFDQALRCPGVAAVWGALPTTDSRWLRRWQLAAEAGGTLGVLLRPATVLARPTWSAIQWHVLPGTGASPSHKKTLSSPRCFERGEGLGVRGPDGESGCQAPASGSIETGSGAECQSPPGGSRRCATKEPGGPTHKKTLPSPRCFERGEGLGVRGPGGSCRCATKEPAASAVPLKEPAAGAVPLQAAVAASLPDWQFRLRLARARSGAGRQIGLRIDAASGRLEVVEASRAVHSAPAASLHHAHGSSRRQLGPIAPPPVCVTASVSRARRGAVA